MKNRITMRLLTLFALLCTISVSASAQWASIWVYEPYDGAQYEVPGSIPIYYELEAPKDLSNEGGSVVIEYSTDDGESWNTIASGIDPFETYYDWVPADDITPSTNYLIRISEVLPSPKIEPIHNAGYSGRFEIFRSCVPPTIFTQPQPQNACSGTDVTMSVQSSALSATYYWSRGATLVSVTRNNFHTIYNATTADAGTYHVNIVEDCGEQTMSANAVLTVTQSPSILVQPVASVIACDQGSTTLRVSATGAGIAYQWRFNGQSIPGMTDSVLFLDPLSTSSTGTYDVVISGSCTPAVTSTPTNVTVIGRPLITSEPQPLVLCPGGNGQLTIGATGSSLSYQWYRDGIPVASDGGSTLTLSNASQATTGTYHVVITSGGINPAACPSTATSRDVYVSTIQAPTIISQPTMMDACIARRTELIVTTEGFELNYQWYKDGSPLVNSNSHILILDNATPATAGNYTVRVTGSCGLGVTSATIVVRAVDQPVFNRQPSSATLQVGERLELSATASDAVRVQWYRNSQAIAGATQWTYVVPSAMVSDAGIYTAIASNSCGASVSLHARVLVRDPNSQAPELTLNPTAINFGNVPVGYLKVMTLVNLLTNTGNAPLVVQSVAIVGTGFAITDAPAMPFTLQPNESATISVQVSASMVGAQTAAIGVTSNASIPYEEVALTAVGVQLLSHNQALDYARVVVNMTKDMCVNVTNTSGAPITVDRLTVQGIDASMFTVVTPTPVDVAAGASTDLCVRFTPTTTGARTAQLSILSSTAGNSSVALAGEGELTSGVEDDAASLMSAHPNPTSGEVTLRLTDFPATRIDIVSVSGVVIRTLSITDKTSTSVMWDGLDAGGSPAASGAYLVVVHGLNNVISMPITVIR
ncbi:MAG: choice-of-anchor D domain-containing protein [bacterium]|nr:choice-of-anchor D domain-containing protein [bacterium]